MSNNARGIGFDQRLDNRIKSTNTDEPTENQSAKAKQEHRPSLSYRSPAISKVMRVVPPKRASKAVSIPRRKSGCDYTAQVREKLFAISAQYWSRLRKRVLTGTPVASTKPQAFATASSKIQTPHPNIVFSVRCLLSRNILTKTIFAAKWLYRAPATKKFGNAKPHATLAHTPGRLKNDGLWTADPR